MEITNEDYIARLEALAERYRATIKKQAEQIEIMIKDKEYLDFEQVLREPHMASLTQFQIWSKEQRKWWKEVFAL